MRCGCMRSQLVALISTMDTKSPISSMKMSIRPRLRRCIVAVSKNSLPWAFLIQSSRTRLSNLRPRQIFSKKYCLSTIPQPLQVLADRRLQFRRVRELLLKRCGEARHLVLEWLTVLLIPNISTLFGSIKTSPTGNIHRLDPASHRDFIARNCPESRMLEELDAILSG